MANRIIQNDILSSLVNEIQKNKGDVSPIKGKDIAQEIRSLEQPSIDGMLPTTITAATKSSYDLLRSLLKIPGISTLGTGKDGYSRLFQYMEKMIEIPHLDLRGVNSATYIFSYCNGLTDIPQFDFGDVIDASYAFYYAENLSTIGTLTGKKVQNGSGMFYGCKNLQSIDKLDMPNLTSVSSMFNGCANLIQEPEIDLSNVTSIYALFSGCTKIIPKTEYVLPVVNNANSAFTGTSVQFAPDIIAPQLTTCNNLYSTCPSLKAGKIPKSNALTSFSYLFNGCPELTSVGEEADTSLVTNASYMCQDCAKLEHFPTFDWSSLTNGAYMFKGCTLLSDFDMSSSMNLTNGNYMFYKCSNLTKSPLGNTSKTTNMAWMFCDCVKLTDVSGVDTSSATTTERLFCNCPLLKDIPDLDFSLTTKIDWLFAGTGKTTYGKMIFPKATSGRELFAQSKIESIEELDIPVLSSSTYVGMFYQCPQLKTVGKINAPVLTGLYNMFNGCTVLETIDELYAPKTTTGYCAFASCSNLTEIKNLTIGQITSAYNMFYNCNKLQSIPEIDFSKNTTLNYTFYKCELITETPPIDLTNTTTLSYAFYGCSNLKKIIFKGNCSKITSTLQCFTNLSPTGVMYYPYQYDYSNIIKLLPEGWTAEPTIEITEYTDLVISAADVSWKKTTTPITYTITVNGIDAFTGEEVSGIQITRVVESAPFEQNLTEADIIREISFSIGGLTATTTITHRCRGIGSYTVDLNGQWRLSSVSNPDSTIYEGVYESNSNYNRVNSEADMFINIEGYADFGFYIRSNGETNCDYMMVSQLDKDITRSTSYSNTEYVKAHTYGKANAGTDISNYIFVEFNNLDGDEHTIKIIYRKDQSVNSGTDRGYVLIPLNQ